MKLDDIYEQEIAELEKEMIKIYKKMDNHIFTILYKYLKRGVK